MWPFFNLQSQMKRISNNRQKLVLIRSKKPSTPPKMQPNKLSSLKLATLHSGFAIRQSNVKKPLNSSIFGKQNEGALLLRCRSISCVDKERLQNKPIYGLNKFYSNSQKQDKNRVGCPQVYLATLDFVLKLKKRGFFSNQTNIYRIPSEVLTDVIMEFGQKIKQEFQKPPMVHSDDTFSSKHGSSLHLASRLSESFVIEEQFSIAVRQESKQLSYQSKIVNLRIEGEAFQQSKCFQQAIDTFTLRPDQQALSFLCDKLKYLQQEVKSRSNNIRQLTNQIDTLAIQKQEHEAELFEIEELITAKHNALSKLQTQVKDIEGFIYRQPNRILQKEAQGYKQREQELFDLAFIMDQSSIESVSTYVQESIMIPYESFKLTISTFLSHYPDEQGNYKISKAGVDAFKTSVSAVYGSTVAKLKSIIEAKFNKIRDFVGIMRRLASYTIGKREYLTEINKKMASASLNTEEYLKKLRKSLTEQQETIDVLQGLFESMKNAYCEAEVFY